MKADFFIALKSTIRGAILFLFLFLLFLFYFLFLPFRFSHIYFARFGFRIIFRYQRQGCQMAYFLTKNPNLGKSWRVLQWKL
jgi:hypothetical protein